MHIKPILYISLLALTLAAFTAYDQQAAADETTAGKAAPPPSPFILTASIQDLMQSLVDPSADALWESVSTISTKDGVIEKRPRTDKDWLELRHKAIALLESTNLLAMQGRHVIEKGQKLMDEGLEGNLTPVQIQKLIDKNPIAFAAFAHGLHSATMKALKAIDNKDVDAFLNAGGDIDSACEACHLEYWYPGHGVPGGG